MWLERNREIKIAWLKETVGGNYDRITKETKMESAMEERNYDRNNKRDREGEIIIEK